jgi:hypothetical protein
MSNAGCIDQCLSARAQAKSAYDFAPQRGRVQHHRSDAMPAAPHDLSCSGSISTAVGPLILSAAAPDDEFYFKQLEAGTIKAPKIVWQEVHDGTDELAQWVSQRREKGLWVNASQDVQKHFGTVSAHVASKYKPHQAGEFLKGGDGWVIAHAMASGGTVVTEESTRSRKAKVKIPTVCKALSVRCVNTFTMLEELNAGTF